MSLSADAGPPPSPPVDRSRHRAQVAWAAGLIVGTFAVVAILVLYGLAAGSAAGGCGGG